MSFFGKPVPAFPGHALGHIPFEWCLHDK